MKAFRYVLLFCLLSSMASRAGCQQEEENLKATFQDAEYFLITEDYQEALSAYLRLNWSDKENANIAYRIGMCYLNLPGEKTKALPYLQMAAAHVTEKYTESTFGEKLAPPQTLFLLATAYQIDNQLDEAKKTFQKYKSYLKVKDVYEIDFVDRQISACDYAKKLMKEPIPVEVKVADEMIPQSGQNFGAVLSSDGKTLVYMTEEKFYKAIWMVRKLNNRWTNPVNITPQVQSDGDAYPTSLSPDGLTLYLVRSSDFGADIYISQFEHETWSKMKKLDKPVNSKYYETHASISSDGNTLYFASNRKGSLGGADIYYSVMNTKGKWDEPVNLGPIINTPYNEQTPFICDDGVTLYFSSQGHQGMGGFDTYKSIKQPDGSWSEPVNIGFPLNTTDDNMFFYPLENGEKALYAGSMGDRQDYGSVKEIEFISTFPAKLVAIDGKLETGDNLQEFGQGFSIHVVNKSNNDTLHILLPDAKTGNFNDTLPAGNYEFITSAAGYESQTKTVNIPSDFQRSQLNLSFSLVPEKVSSGEYIVIRNILFDFNSYVLSDSAKLDIERLFQVMERYPDLFVEVAGHTDSRGSAAYNYKLSKNRAHAVISYLIAKGIDPVRFVTKGLGETSNIAMDINPDGSDNSEGRRLNRNAEIRILQPGKYPVVLEPIAVPDYLKPERSAEYTILLLRSPQPIGNNTFDPLHTISGDPVKEDFSGSEYCYTFGRFFSYIQAAELLKSSVKPSFPNASVIRRNTIAGQADEAATIATSENQHFGIQIFALRKPADMKLFRSLGDVQMIRGDDGFYRVIYGDYNAKEDAGIDIVKIKSRGYEDAFIIDLSLLHTYKQQSVSRLSGNADGRLLTIQLKALRTPVSKNYFSRLNGIRVIQGGDGIFRYVYMEFADMENAQAELKRIKDLGFTDAFIRKTNKIPDY